VINSRIKTYRFPDRIPPRYCDYISTGDNQIADQALGFEWENPGTMNTSYGYNQNDNRWVDAKQIVFRLVDIVSKGGNYLLNVGPTSEGLIPQPSVDRLLEVGTWMETNQEAIYGTSAWKVYGEGPRFAREETRARTARTAAATGEARNANAAPASLDIRFTAKGNSVYAICLAWPEKEARVTALGKKGLPNQPIKAVRMLGSKEEIKWRQTEDGLSLSVPQEQPCRYAFVYRIDLL